MRPGRAALMDGAIAPSVAGIINIAVPQSGYAFGKAAPRDFAAIVERSYARTFLVLKYGIQVLRACGGGPLISVTSNDFLIGREGASARCAAANGIALMSKSAALECAAKQDGVRVNTVLCGDVQAGSHERYAPGHVSADDVVAAVAYLLSPAAQYLTGLLLPVDNGRFAR